MHAVTVTGITHKGVVDRVVHAHAARALNHWLHHHGADFLVLFIQQSFHGYKLSPRIVFVGFASLFVVRVRRRGGEYFHQQWLVGVFVERNVTPVSYTHL